MQNLVINKIPYLKKSFALTLFLSFPVFIHPVAPGTSPGTGNPAVETPRAREIMEKARDASKFRGLEAISTLRIYDARGRERVRQISMASREFDNGATEKRIIRFLSPPEVKGTGMLIFDYRDKNDDMWIYMPALRKTRRIISREKSKSFMGSEFSNADMSAPNPADFNYSMLRSESLEGADCWVIEAKPLSEEVMDEMGYESQIVWIDKSNYVLRKAEYFNGGNEPFKRLTAGNIQAIDPASGKYMATRMEILNRENGRRSVMTMDKIQYNPDVTEEYFSIAYLEKL